MAIGKPKAIDDAPDGRGPRRVSSRWGGLRAGAQRRMAKGRPPPSRGHAFLPREEWANRGPRRAFPAGWRAQGKKVDPAPLRLRRSRRSRPSARSSHREAVWSARRIASSGEDVEDVERRAQEARPTRRRKRSRGGQKGWRPDLLQPGRRQRPCCWNASRRAQRR
jgi:hypothetical protein